MSSQPRRLGGSEPSIALLLDWLEDDYQSAILRGAADACRERGLNLICFSGGELHSPERNGVQRNQVFELATTSSVAGVLIMSGTLSNYAGPQRLAEYCQRYGAMPAVAVGVPLQGLRSVLVDNETGMREAVEHLVLRHGKRRLLFIRGPRLNEEAERRFAVYRAVLEANDIAFDPELALDGDFQPAAGRNAIFQTLQRGVAFDAVVAANDEMARGALLALQERGIAVPDPVAVIGFDDIEEARFLEPSLSTVRQPLVEQGKQAVRLLVSALQGLSQQDDVVLRTELMIRTSCGCTGAQSGLSELKANAGRLDFEAQLISRRSLVLAELVRAAQASFGGLGAGWESRLLAALVDDVTRKSPGGFLSAYGDALQQAARTGNPIDAWHDVLSALRHNVLGALSNDFEGFKRAESLFNDARLVTSQFVERAQAKKRLDAERLTRSVAKVGAALLGTFDEQALYAACRELLPALGLRSAYIVRTSGQSEEVELVYAHDGASTEVLDLPRRFHKAELLPADMLPKERPYTLIVEPLLFGGDVLGYAVFSYGPKEGTLYESLRDQISAALFGSRLKTAVLTRPVTSP